LSYISRLIFKSYVIIHFENRTNSDYVYKSNTKTSQILRIHSARFKKDLATRHDQKLKLGTPYEANKKRLHIKNKEKE
jgi:hypothetical protein